MNILSKSDAVTFLRSRRSIRRFKSNPIPVEIIQRILDTATFAPSAHNLQPWRFVIIANIDVKIQMAEDIASRFREDMLADGLSEVTIKSRVEQTIRRAREAPVIIILCRDITQVKSQPDLQRQQVEELMSMQSVAIAGLQLLLSAHAEGIGASWICWPLFAKEETRHALDLPSDWEPEAMFFLGYPGEQPEIPEKRPLSEISLWL
jgi:coenzyme F420-0:L-glutamate ligase/coenzyme F420-1:gamma-L-glutamate ligase